MPTLLYHLSTPIATCLYVNVYIYICIYMRVYICCIVFYTLSSMPTLLYQLPTHPHRNLLVCMCIYMHFVILCYKYMLYCILRIVFHAYSPLPPPHPPHPELLTCCRLCAPDTGTCMMVCPWPPMACTMMGWPEDVMSWPPLTCTIRGCACTWQGGGVEGQPRREEVSIGCGGRQ